MLHYLNFKSRHFVELHFQFRILIQYFLVFIMWLDIWMVKLTFLQFKMIHNLFDLNYSNSLNNSNSKKSILSVQKNKNEENEWFAEKSLEYKIKVANRSNVYLIEWSITSIFSKFDRINSHSVKNVQLKYRWKNQLKREKAEFRTEWHSIMFWYLWKTRNMEWSK